MYYLIRGWVECDPDDLTFFRDLIESVKTTERDVVNSYLDGWVFPEHVMNWAGYFFYGSCVKENGVFLFNEVLNLLCSSRKNVDGFFQINDQYGGNRTMLNITNDVIN